MTRPEELAREAANAWIANDGTFLRDHIAAAIRKGVSEVGQEMINAASAIAADPSLTTDHRTAAKSIYLTLRTIRDRWCGKSRQGEE